MSALMTEGITRRELLKWSSFTAIAPINTSVVSEQFQRQNTETPSSSTWPMFHGDAENSGATSATTAPTTTPSSEWAFDTYGPIESSAAISENKVYTGSMDGYLYAVDATDGSRNWRFLTDGQIVGTPAVQNDSVYAGSTEGTLYAFNTTDGSVKWQSPTSGSLTAPTIIGGNIYVGSYDSKVYSFDITDGSKNWEFKTNAPITRKSRISDAPAVANNSVYIGNDDGEFYAINTSDGTKEWQKSVSGGHFWAASVVNDVVYAGSTNGTLYAFNADDGSTLWTFNTPLRASATAVANDTVYVGSYEGRHEGEYKTHLFSINAADGSENWHFQTPGKVLSAPVVINDLVYFGNYSPGDLYAINTADGSEEWTFSTGDSVSAPAVADGTIYIGSYDSKLYALSDSNTSNSPPTASFDYSPDSPETGQSLSLDASPSSDSDGSISTYEWDIDDDGTFEKTGDAISWTFDSAGDKPITLRVTDSDGLTSTVTETISVSKGPFEQIKESHLATAQEVAGSSVTKLHVEDYAQTANSEYTTAVNEGDISEDTAIEAIQRLNTGVDITATVIDYIGPDSELAGENQVNLTKSMALPTIKTALSIAMAASATASKAASEGGSLLTQIAQSAKGKAIDAVDEFIKGMLGNAADIEGTIEVEASQLAEELLNNFFSWAAGVQSAIEDIANTLAELVSTRLREYVEEGIQTLPLELKGTPVDDSPVSLQAGVDFFYNLLDVNRVKEDGLSGSTNTALSEASSARSAIESQASTSETQIQDIKDFMSNQSIYDAMVTLVEEPDLESAISAIVSVILTIVGGLFDAVATGAGIGGLININLDHHIGLLEVSRGDPL